MTDFARTWADSYRTRLAIGYLLVVALFASAWAWSLFGPLTDAIVEQQRTTSRLSPRQAHSCSGRDERIGHRDGRATHRAHEPADDDRGADGTRSRRLRRRRRHRWRTTASGPRSSRRSLARSGVDRRVSATQGSRADSTSPFRPASTGIESRYVSRTLSNASTRSPHRHADSDSSLLAVALVIAAIRRSAHDSHRGQTRRAALRRGPSMAHGNLSTDIPDGVGRAERALLGTERSTRTDETSTGRPRDRAAQPAHGARWADRRGLPAARQARSASRTALGDACSAARHWLEGQDARRRPSCRNQSLASRAPGAAGRRNHGRGVRARHERSLSARDGPSAQLRPCLHDRTLVVVTDVTERIRVDQRSTRLRRQREPRTQDTHRGHPPARGIGGRRRERRRRGSGGRLRPTDRRGVRHGSPSSSKTCSTCPGSSRLPAPDAVTDVREAVRNALVGHRWPPSHAASRSSSTTARCAAATSTRARRPDRHRGRARQPARQRDSSTPKTAASP